MSSFIHGRTETNGEYRCGDRVMDSSNLWYCERVSNGGIGSGRSVCSTLDSEWCLVRRPCSTHL